MFSLYCRGLAIYLKLKPDTIWGNMDVLNGSING